MQNYCAFICTIKFISEARKCMIFTDNLIGISITIFEKHMQIREFPNFDNK